MNERVAHGGIPGGASVMRSAVASEQGVSPGDRTGGTEAT